VRKDIGRLADLQGGGAGDKVIPGDQLAHRTTEGEGLRRKKVTRTDWRTGHLDLRNPGPPACHWIRRLTDYIRGTVTGHAFQPAPALFCPTGGRSSRAIARRGPGQAEVSEQGQRAGQQRRGRHQNEARRAPTPGLMADGGMAAVVAMGLEAHDAQRADATAPPAFSTREKKHRRPLGRKIKNAPLGMLSTGIIAIVRFAALLRKTVSYFGT
jgi:hypothetical protein